MLDERKVRKIVSITFVTSLLISFSLGYSLGGRTKEVDGTQKKHKTNKEFVNKQSDLTLTQDLIKDFLIAYFTKKDLGENRNRYKPFLTERAYENEIDHEELPMNKTYKGYIVDQEFKSANIFINQTTLEAIVNVTYIHTLLNKKSDYTNAQKDVSNQLTIKLQYQKVDGELRIDSIAPVMLLEDEQPI